ncbi:YtcA family lipoprotein [Paraburkholderia oxyphila]|uniref:YtcA family lipoprotein n=1 Tax=Paraburkholderia oxyphila TaxID=614212 RepID=UPI0009FC1AAA|nr:YtcA family lipoprotein [Paraburkholderia oxyphila]
MPSLIPIHRPTRCLAAGRILCGLALPWLAGCSVSPSISVLGAYFPDWMFCFLGSLAVTLIVRAVLVRLQRESLLGPPFVAYSSLLLLFSLLFWLLFFNS